MPREGVFRSHHVYSRGLRSAAEFLSPVAALRVRAKAPRQATHSSATVRRTFNGNYPFDQVKDPCRACQTKKKDPKNIHSTGQALSVVDGELVDVDARIESVHVRNVCRLPHTPDLKLEWRGTVCVRC